MGVLLHTYLVAVGLKNSFAAVAASARRVGGLVSRVNFLAAIGTFRWCCLQALEAAGAWSECQHIWTEVTTHRWAIWLHSCFIPQILQVCQLPTPCDAQVCAVSLPASR